MYDDIEKLNSGINACKVFAIVYRYAVKQFGYASFNGIAIANSIKQSDKDYNKAIMDFFKYGTPEQFEDFLKSYNDEDYKKLLSNPIVYEKSKGLHNE